MKITRKTVLGLLGVLLALLLFGTQMLPALLLAIHILAANPALRQRLCATGFACAQVHSLQRGAQPVGGTPGPGPERRRSHPCGGLAF